jgi:hypothetical protein
MGLHEQVGEDVVQDIVENRMCLDEREKEHQHRGRRAAKHRRAGNWRDAEKRGIKARAQSSGLQHERRRLGAGKMAMLTNLSMLPASSRARTKPALPVEEFMTGKTTDRGGG